LLFVQQLFNSASACFCFKEKYANFVSHFPFVMKITKKRYIQSFGLVVIFLSVIRTVFPSIAEPGARVPASGTGDSIRTDIVSLSEQESPRIVTNADGRPSRFFDKNGLPVKNPIYSVPHFGNTFPDQNDVQLASARKHGVEAVADRADAERRKSELVYVGSNPYFHVDKLHSSIPYLVPEAAVLLQDIGRNFFDSLQIKGVPLHKIIVTSVLRSKQDVMNLRGHNGNATENSCHLYGTTFDICYNRYKTVEDYDGPKRRKVRNDTLKWILSEVLDDLRQEKRCLVKYEVKQGCFHITVN